MKSLFLISCMISISVWADPCADLRIYPSRFAKGTPGNDCAYPINHVKHKILIQASEYEGTDGDKIILAEELAESCGLASHYYVEEGGVIIQARNDYEQGPGNGTYLVIQVLLSDGEQELSPAFVSKFSTLLRCKIAEHYIRYQDVIVREDGTFNPGSRVRNLVRQILEIRP